MKRYTLDYNGKLTTYQQEAPQYKGRIYQQVEFTERQNYLYNRLVYGLSYLPKEEVKAMKRAKQKRIVFFHRKAQALINTWKQQRVITLSDYVFKTLFPKSPMALEIVHKYGKPIQGECEMSFKSLNLTKVEIIDGLMKAGLLPENFYKTEATT